MASRPFRRTFAASAVSDRLAMQIYSLRSTRGWTQERAALETGMAQPRISALESDCHNVTMTTLRRIADAYDVGLQVKFVPFSSLLMESIIDAPDKAVPSFEMDKSPSEAFRVWSYFKPSDGQPKAMPMNMTTSSHTHLSMQPDQLHKTSFAKKIEAEYVH